MEGSSGKRNFDGSCQLLSFKVNEETHLIDLDLMLQPENTYEVWEQPVKYRL